MARDSPFPRLHPETIQEHIIRVARERGLTGYAFAKLSGLNESAAYRYLRGESDMTGATLDRVLRAMGLEITERPEPKPNGRKK